MSADTFVDELDAVMREISDMLASLAAEILRAWWSAAT